MTPDESFWFAGVVMVGVMFIIFYLIGVEK